MAASPAAAAATARPAPATVAAWGIDPGNYTSENVLSEFRITEYWDAE